MLRTCPLKIWRVVLRFGSDKVRVWKTSKYSSKTWSTTILSGIKEVKALQWSEPTWALKGRTPVSNCTPSHHKPQMFEPSPKRISVNRSILHKTLNIRTWWAHRSMSQRLSKNTIVLFRTKRSCKVSRKKIALIRNLNDSRVRGKKSYCKLISCQQFTVVRTVNSLQMWWNKEIAQHNKGQGNLPQVIRASNRIIKRVRSWQGNWMGTGTPDFNQTKIDYSLLWHQMSTPREIRS